MADELPGAPIHYRLQATTSLVAVSAAFAAVVLDHIHTLTAAGGARLEVLAEPEGAVYARLYVGEDVIELRLPITAEES